MADVTITDTLGATADFQIRDDSPLAKAKLTQIVSAGPLSTGKELFGELGKPLDQVDLKGFSLGAQVTSPDLLSSSLERLTVVAGANSALHILTSADGTVFGKNQFSPSVPIATNEAWLSVELDLAVSARLSLSSNSVGVSFEGDSKFACSTLTRFSAPKPPFPSFRDALAEAVSNFSITTGACAIRLQPVGTINQTDVAGSITARLSLKQPFNLNALASANLPFNTTVNIKPNVTLQVSGSVAISGEFIFRSYKKADGVVQIGVYKKQGTTLSASFTAAAGIGVDIGTGDVLGPLLTQALPGVDFTAAGITADSAATLNRIINNGINRSLSAQLNSSCSATFTDEAAVVYEIQLDAGDPATTDEALTLALQGDWTTLDDLSNAHRIRNIVADSVEKRNAVTLNLFGLLSAVSVTDYMKKCTILLDESGQLSIIDRLETNRIAALSFPYASDSEKLRTALMQDFVCTATYAVIKGHLDLRLTITQTFLDYQRNMSRSQMRQNIVLGYQLGVLPPGSLDGDLNAAGSFSQALVSATVRYSTPALMSVFFSEPVTLTPRSQTELEQIGRDTMRAFLDPLDPTNAPRIRALSNSETWAAMNATGNTAAFGQIATLQNLNQVQLAAIAADWVSVRWWADALVKVAPALSDVLAVLKTLPPGDPSANPDFMKRRDRLAGVLGGITRNTNAAFVHGWGEAVTFALSGRAGTPVMDLAWNGHQYHYGQP
jgi:hypothetical protein